jgi:hypothetical protein
MHHTLSGFRVLDQRFQSRGVLTAQNISKIDAFARITGGGFSRGLDEAIGNAAHGRHYYDAPIPPGGLSNDLRRTRHARGVANGRAAKFHYLQR